jgi:hypothetical protein
LLCSSGGGGGGGGSSSSSSSADCSELAARIREATVCT